MHIRVSCYKKSKREGRPFYSNEQFYIIGNLDTREDTHNFFYGSNTKGRVPPPPQKKKLSQQLLIFFSFFQTLQIENYYSKRLGGGGLTPTPPSSLVVHSYFDWGSQNITKIFLLHATHENTVSPSKVSAGLNKKVKWEQSLWGKHKNSQLLYNYFKNCVRNLKTKCSELS